MLVSVEFVCQVLQGVSLHWGSGQTAAQVRLQLMHSVSLQAEHTNNQLRTRALTRLAGIQ